MGAGGGLMLGYSVSLPTAIDRATCIGNGGFVCARGPPVSSLAKDRIGAKPQPCEQLPTNWL